MVRQMIEKLVLAKVLKLYCGVAAGVLLAACVPAARAQARQPVKATAAAAKETRPVIKAAAFQTKTAEPAYKVFSPLGEPTVKMITMVPRLNTLAGKTVCTIWNGAFKSDVTLPVIGESLKKSYPGIKIVPYTEFSKSQTPEAPGTPLTESIALQAALKEKGCEAVISGNGG